MPTNLRLAPDVTDVEDASNPDPTSVVLADDHVGMRRTLRRVLDAEDGITVIAEAVDLETATRQVQAHSPQVLILDLRLPNGSRIATTRALRRAAPATQIVVLTMEISPASAQQTLQAGALGYVLKEHADRDLVAAIRCAAHGESYVTSEVATGLEALRL
jgi:two-component system, NarL family, response regulator NreC